MDNDQREIYTVSQINSEIRRLLESNYPRIWVEGELSNFSAPRSGHWYLTLKDQGAQISCAMFKTRNRLVQFQPKDGDKIQVCGRLSLYQERGNYQLIIDHMRPAGAGQLQLQFEQLKKQLQAEGLFNPEHKQSLPKQANHIGIITSSTGAAIRDMLHTFKRRFPCIEITIFPVPVQGNHAAAKIAQAIEKANTLKCETPIDALIVGRGGGSLEDLWAFNEEVVARAIFASALPIVSAVGHETDFSISDFVADVRAPTPTAAAEYLSPEKSHYLEHLHNYQLRLAYFIHATLKHKQQDLKILRHQLVHPGQKIDQQKIQLDFIEHKLQQQMWYLLNEKKYQLNSSKQALAMNNPQDQISQLKDDLMATSIRLFSAQKQQLKQSQLQLQHIGQLLHAVSPLATLTRGFSISKDESGNLIRKTQQVKIGDTIFTQISDGTISSSITKIN